MIDRVRTKEFTLTGGAWTESEAARFLGISSSGLRKWRNNRTGPKFVRLGRLIRYIPADVEAWLEGKQDA
jgi:predicted DNA-binding transcriptional regulator AlpA